MALTYQTTRRVEFSHTDMAGIMHFSRYFNMMEEVETEFLRSRGISVMMLHEGRKIGFPRVAAACDYVRPVLFEDVVDITLTMERLGTKSISYRFDFAKGGEPVAVGKLTVCCVVHEADKIYGLAIPEDIRAKLSAPASGDIRAV